MTAHQLVVFVGTNLETIVPPHGKIMRIASFLYSFFGKTHMHYSVTIWNRC